LEHSTFSGFPAFLRRAAEDLGLDPSHAEVAPPAALGAMANLCAQASTAAPGHATEILKEAVAFRDRLLVAARAAELMLGDVARPSSLAECPAPASQPLHGEGPGRPRPARPSNRPTTLRP
jgi:hypothetical protein